MGSHAVDALNRLNLGKIHSHRLRKNGHQHHDERWSGVVGEGEGDAAGLIQEADAALYDAKNNGRNRVAGPRSSLSLVARRE